MISISGCIGLVMSLCAAASIAAETKQAQFTLKDVSFLQGNWSSKTKTGALVEEFWSDPKGAGMVGYCRFIKDRKTTFYELLAIVELKDQIVLRMKHFNEHLVAWSDKEEAGDCIMTEGNAQQIVFDNRNESHRVRVIYKRSGTNSLHVTVEDTTDGKPVKHEFDYRKSE